MNPHVLHVSGNSRERGRQYGEGLRAAILQRDARWKEHIGIFSGIDPNEFIAAHLAGTNYLPAVERWTPGLLDEVRGMAEGAGLSFEHAFAAQLMDEEWLYWEAFRGRHHCSSLASAAPTVDFALAAQNMDLPAWMNGSQTILHLEDPATGLESIVLTVAGMIGLCGMNNAGLAVVVNTLSELPSATDGLPVAFVSRGLLSHKSLADARRFLYEVNHAAGQNYILAGRLSVEDHECSAEGKNRFRPTQAVGEAVWHTNHSLAGGHVVHTQELAATGGSANSHARMDTMNARLGATGGAWDMATAISALCNRDHADYPISRRFEGGVSDHGFTFASVIWELAPALRAHVAAGPPHDTAYQTFGIKAGLTLRAAE